MAGEDVYDEQTERWLVTLRDGTVDEKKRARRGLAYVFEQRGMLAEATELLKTNVARGVHTSETVRWPARLYRAQGDRERAVAVEAEAARCQSSLATALTTRMRPVAVEATIPPPAVWTIRDLAPYLVFLIALGSALGAGAWLILPVVGAIVGR